MSFEAPERDIGTRPDSRDARIESLERERDRLREELSETRNRFRRFAKASGKFATSMRGRMSERRRLDLQHAVLGALESPANPEETAVKVLEVLGHGLERSLGVFWLADGDSLRCAGTWRPDGVSPSELERVCLSMRFQTDGGTRNGRASGSGLSLRGLPIRVRDEGRAVWVRDLREAGDPRTEAAAGEEVGGALAFPVSNGGGLFGIVELFGPATEAPDEGLLRTLSVLGNQIAQFVERKRAEETLRESENRLRRAIQIETVGVNFLKTDGSITDANDAFLRMSGFSREDLAGGKVRWDEMTPEEWMPRTLEAVDEFKTTGRITPYEKEYLRKDGSRWWALFAATRLNDEEGVEFVIDITGSKQAEVALRESEEWLRLAERAARSGTWEWDLGSGEIRWSDEHRALFGFGPEGKITRQRWLGAIHPDDAPRIEEAGRRCSEEGEEWPEIEYRISRADNGDGRWINARGRTLRDEMNRPLRILGISMDVTRRKQAEVERERLRALEVMARAQAAERVRISRELHDRVAHDMAVVLQGLQLHEALRENDPERAAAKLGAAKATIRSALDATRDLSSELRRPAVEGGMEVALRELLGTYVPDDVKTSFSFDGDESSILEHIRSQFYLIVREAVRNAVKHSGCHHLTVEIEALPGKVFGSVGDDGCGFDAEGAHDGVGLESMRERAELLKGALHLVPGPGGGTMLEVSVPLLEPPEER